MSFIFFIFCFSLTGVLCAEENPENELASATKKTMLADAPLCTSIVLSSEGTGSAKVDLKELGKRLEDLFLSRPIATQLIADIKQEITQYFEEKKQSLIAIKIPDQKVTLGVIQITICTSCLGDLKVECNDWTSSDLLKNYFKTDCGGRINDQLLRRDLEFMNRNPFRHVNAVLSPGKWDSTTDVTLLVEERRQLRLYAGADNTGVRTTGRQRFYAGLNWGKAFGLDHIFSYQYTSSYNINEFQAHTMQYQAFLPWMHVLNVYGGYSYVHPHLGFTPTTGNRGQSGQGSLRYTVPLMPMGSFTHEFTMGFDFKRTNNTIEFSDLFIHFSKNVNLTQLALEYSLEKTWSKCRLDFDLQGYYSPGRWLPDQSDVAYSALRPGAKNAYVYARGSLNTLFYLKHSWYLNFLFRGQGSSQKLLPSEQYCVGGYDTVRGYDQWQLNVDAAVLASAELRTPQIKVFKRKRECVNDVLQFLAFVDFGYGQNYKVIPGEDTPQYLLGAGPGARYTWDPYFTARLDYGIKCHKNPEFTGGASMVHFNATLSY